MCVCPWITHAGGMHSWVRSVLTSTCPQASFVAKMPEIPLHFRSISVIVRWATVGTIPPVPRPRASSLRLSSVLVPGLARGARFRAGRRRCAQVATPGHGPVSLPVPVPAGIAPGGPGPALRLVRLGLSDEGHSTRTLPTDAGRCRPAGGVRGGSGVARVAAGPRGAPPGRRLGTLAAAQASPRPLEAAWATGMRRYCDSDP